MTLLYVSENNITNIAAISDLTNLNILWLATNSISDISALSGLIALTELDLYENEVSDITALTGLVNLTKLQLSFNSIIDIAPLIVNTGIGFGDDVSIGANLLSCEDPVTMDNIAILEERGVVLGSECATEVETD